MATIQKIVGQLLAIAAKLCQGAPTGRKAAIKVECSAWVDWPGIKKAQKTKLIRCGLSKISASLPHCGLSARRSHAHYDDLVSAHCAVETWKDYTP
ncbi:hypothetical protein [Ensifer sp. BR816]|uniref:hypothetical protein n=1 Tax=Rhizobium sp. (strain BR816) TaxID=1057002 RepID=UPI0012F79D73|nr:hypothetical protein [Ensifer sp. BR816]